MDNVKSVEYRFIRPVGTRIMSRTGDKFLKPIKVFARTACVGNLVLAKSFRPTRISSVHAQKGQIDHFNSLLKNNHRNFNLKVNQISSLTENCKNWFLQNQNPNLLTDFLTADFSLFDSFCELTDKKVRITEEIYAFGHKGDFFKTKEDQLIFEEVEIESIENSFINLLNRKKVDETGMIKPLIYLHYSSTNDSRQHLKKRSESLLLMAKNLQSKFDHFRLLNIEEREYTHAETDLFPYHYSKNTTDKLASKLSAILSDYNIKTSRYVLRI